MITESIIPQGFVPTSECIRWLNLEAMRLLNTQHETVMNWLNSNAKTIGIFREIINNAFNEAFDRNMTAEKKRLDDDFAEYENWLAVMNPEIERLDRLLDDRDNDDGMPF